MLQIRNPRLSGSLGLGFGAALLASACSSDDGGGGGGGSSFFEPRNSSQAVAAVTPITVRGNWLVYLADEATTGDPVAMTTATDFNGDGDTIDNIAVAIDMVNKGENNLAVAAVEVHILDSNIYVVVDEAADGRNWGGNPGLTDRVLLLWSDSTPLTFVDLIRDEGLASAAVANGRLYYSADSSPSGNATSLRYVMSSNPTLPVTIDTTDVDAMMNQVNHEPGILGVDGDLLFCVLEETDQGDDLNFLVDPALLTKAYDGDTTDQVLAVLDTSQASNTLYNTGIALGDDDVPFRARETGSGDWLVGVLRNEAAHGQLAGGQGGFNDLAMNEPFSELPATFLPSGCAPDGDLNDDVLCWFRLNAWIADPVGARIANTGLAGIASKSSGGVVAITVGSPGFVATIQPEGDQGNCDLNGDGDMSDEVTRWAETSLPPSFFFTDSNQIVATSSVNGGGTSLFELENNLIATVDEEDDDRDHDNNPATDLEGLIGSLDPSDGLAAVWIFDHNLTTDELYIDTDYAVMDGDSERLLHSISEETFDESLNPGDMDLNDHIAGIATLNSSQNDLNFEVSRVALDPARGGLRSGKGYLFFRANEASDSMDWNGDGDETDIVLIRVTENSGFTAFVVTIASNNRPALEFGDPSNTSGGAIIANEAADDRDWNGDGDKNDFTIRWFRF